MERLTAKCLKGSGYYMACSKTCPYDCMEDCDCEEFDNFVDRLGAIEDILGDEYDLNLVQRLIQAYKEGRYIIMKEPEQAGVSRLRELAQADREGRCVVLPVKPGTPVWSTAFCKVDDDGTEHPTYPWPFDIGMANEWGTEWFLTQEEAEAALRREQDGNRI